MELILFPFERVVQINAFILENEPGMKGSIDLKKLQGALGRIDNGIVYEGLNQHWFRTLEEAKYEIEKWQEHYNHVRPHSSLNYLSPKEFVEQAA